MLCIHSLKNCQSDVDSEPTNNNKSDDKFLLPGISISINKPETTTKPPPTTETTTKSTPTPAPTPTPPKPDGNIIRPSIIYFHTS